VEESNCETAQILLGVCNRLWWRNIECLGVICT